MSTKIKNNQTQTIKKTNPKNTKTKVSQNEVAPEVIPTLLFNVSYPNIFALTEEGHVIKVELTEQQKKDSLFWRVLDKIKQAKIWIPLSKSQHQLLDTDWMAVN